MGAITFPCDIQMGTPWRLPVAVDGDCAIDQRGEGGLLVLETLST